LTSVSQTELPEVSADVFLTMHSMKSCLILFTGLQQVLGIGWGGCAERAADSLLYMQM